MTKIFVTGRAGRVGCAALIGLLVASCMQTAAPGWLVGPADPALGGKGPRYSDVTRGVQRFGVVEPKDWRELNRASGPQGGGAMPGMDMGGQRGMGAK